MIGQTRKIFGGVYRSVVKEPIEFAKRSYREGGPLQQKLTEQGRKQMIAAARDLTPLQKKNSEYAGKIFFLSGSKFWYQTLFCFGSLHKHSSCQITPVILDDGTLGKEHTTRINEKIPWAEVISHDDLLIGLDRVAPREFYPNIWEWRDRQPLTRKLIDLHVGKTGWKMLLDSDMLFFRRPSWLLDWIKCPTQPAYMVDCVESYGYSEKLRSELSGAKSFPQRANIGIFGYKSDDLDPDWLEFALGALVQSEGPKYNITQGLTSMLFADRDCSIAPEQDYIVLPSLAEGRNPSSVLHHYVAHSKRAYFQDGWRTLYEGL